MARVYPFRALRPPRELAPQVASVPYDVVNRVEAKALAADNLRSFLHVTRPEIDLPDDTDPYADEVYQRGGTALREMIDQGTLVRDETPCFYAYGLTMDGRRQLGVVLCASVEDYERNIVRKHEHTRPNKERDRVRNMEALGAQSGTVFLTHKHSERVAGRLAEAAATEPAADFVAADSVRHQLWVISGASAVADICQGFDELGPIYIADGHHRSAAAAIVAARLEQKDATLPSVPSPKASKDASECTVAAAHESFLGVSFPAEELMILGYNRVIKDLGGLTPVDFLAALDNDFERTPGRQTLEPKCFNLFIDGSWHFLRVRPGSYDDADTIASLDVSILQDLVLAKHLNVGDPRTCDRLDFIGGIRGSDALEKRVQEGWAAAFELFPTSIEQLFAVADDEKVMPPKSTWFEPKLRDGLFVNQIVD